MLKKITAKPDLLLFLVLIVLLLTKNLYFFYEIYTHAGTWGINRSINWLWEMVRFVSMPALKTFCLCGAFLFAIREQRKQALYFIAVLLLLFPFQTLVPANYLYDGFYMIRGERKFSERLLQTVTDYGQWALLVLFLAGMWLAYRLKKSARVFYWVLFGFAVALTIYCDILRTYDETHVGLYFDAIFYGGIGAWMLVALNYLGYKGGTILRNILFYAAVVACIAGIWFLRQLIPASYDRLVLFPFPMAVLGGIVLILLYYLCPRKIVTLFIPFILLLSGVIVVFYYTISPMLPGNSYIIRDMISRPGFILWRVLLSCLVPTLMAPFFRQRTITE